MKEGNKSPLEGREIFPAVPGKIRGVFTER